LARQARRNERIARMFVGRSSAVAAASAHLSHILGTLDAPNRREAAAPAHRLLPPRRPSDGQTALSRPSLPRTDGRG
jgi:hypothetical protein